MSSPGGESAAGSARFSPSLQNGSSGAPSPSGGFWPPIPHRPSLEGISHAVFGRISTIIAPPVQHRVSERRSRRASISANSGLPAFDRFFDEHFEIASDRIDENLPRVDALLAASADASDNDGDADAASTLPSLRGRPQRWGLRVSMLCKFWSYIAKDICDYAAAHLLDENGDHVCLVEPCQWNHQEVEPVVRQAACGQVAQMKANMHLVVLRYIKPWTLTRSAGLAVVLNAGHLSAHRATISSKDLCEASVFISHSWGELFQDFVETLCRSLEPHTVAWVCSFAIWQHGDVASALGSLEAFKRCWCVLEAALAKKWNKNYDVFLPDDSDLSLWRAVSSDLDELNLERCAASHAADKMAILAFARRELGSIRALNQTVRAVARSALKRAEVMAVAQSGNIEALQQLDARKLKSWRCIRGRTATHVAAAHSWVAGIVEICLKIGDCQLDARDNDGRTPICVAAETGAVASVEALVSCKASVDIASHAGLTPLHYAAASNKPACAIALLKAFAEVDAVGTYFDTGGRTPLHVAAREGYVDVIFELIAARADVNAHTANGAVPIFMAAGRGHANATATLIGAQALVDKRQNDCLQRTALMQAVRNGHVAVVGLLLAASASPSARDADENNSLDYAITLSKADFDNARTINAILANFAQSRQLLQRTESTGPLMLRIRTDKRCWCTRWWLPCLRPCCSN
eukprot:TRINITY_DN14990_c0_g1_i1.p1 TRINITY_DN14990_c0_g1~~TRINITY_DN14990_c0_g1_i1.p1  ORF type:complete len:695 (-),score=114.48 TRINITY_DN14990_c0_g1_i1:131-2215(-)